MNDNRIPPWAQATIYILACLIGWLVIGLLVYAGLLVWNLIWDLIAGMIGS